jgi:hypothetical protein
MRLMMADRPRVYAALGDSISIDDYAGGPGCGAASLLFQNKDSDFPEWKGRDLETVLPYSRLLPLAMERATSATVRFVQIPYLKEAGTRLSLATLTMGGNDLLQTFGDRDAGLNAHRALWENGNAVLEALRGLLEPGAPLLIGTIYDLSDGTGDTEHLNIPFWPSAVEGIWRFNEMLRTLAREHGAQVADIHAAFQGHGLKSGDPSADIARPENREMYYCGVIEPNAWGANAIRAVWWDNLRTAGFIKDEATL